MAYPKLTPITATGATAPRYLGDRFADIVNVKDFGAVGDGVADDTTAFTAAQNSGAQAVMVPNGTYKITEDVAGVFFSFGSITTTGGGDVEIIDILSLDSIPTGTVLWLSTPTVPAGYLLCNGAAVGRATYPELFIAIGTTYGAGDGSTTFNLPNLIDKFIEGGSTSGVYKDPGLPNITGIVGGSNLWNSPQSSGAFYSVRYGSNNNASGVSGTDEYETRLDASRSNSIYGNSDTVQPPALTLLPCIKAFSSVIGDATVVAGQLVNDIQSKVALDGSNISSIGATLSEYMAHAAMPSERYVELSVPSSGNLVTAPADGYLCLEGKTTSMNYNFLQLYSGFGSKIVAIQLNDVSILTTLPVSKNSEVFVNYSTNMTDVVLKFFYANGAL